MCLAVYIASCKLLAPRPWNEADPGLHLEALDASHPVSKRLRLPHVYYAGSHEGCGCGFMLDDEDPKCLVSIEGLRLAAIEALRAGVVELIACWEGEQAEPEQALLELAPADLDTCEALIPFLAEGASSPQRLRCELPGRKR